MALYARFCNCLSTLPSDLPSYLDLVRISECLLGLFHISWIRHSFTVFVFLYHCVYDKFRNNYISRIYQHDKYGIVILYATITFMLVFDICMQFERELAVSEIMNSEIPGSTALPLRKWDHVDLIESTRFLGLWSCLQVLCFNLIFKNHTSTMPEHQRSHIFGIVLLLLSSYPCHQYFVKLPFQRVIFVNPNTYFRNKLESFLLLTCCFQSCGWLSDGLKKRNYGFTFKSLNFFTAFFEAMLIEESFLGEGIVSKVLIPYLIDHSGETFWSAVLLGFTYASFGVIFFGSLIFLVERNSLYEAARAVRERTRTSSVFCFDTHGSK